MGTVLGTKTIEGDKILFEVEVDYDESLQLNGHTHHIHVFSEDAAEIKTHISQRGTNEATKYFLIPKELRKDMKFKENVKCQKIDLGNKTLFVFVVDKAEKD